MCFAAQSAIAEPFLDATAAAPQPYMQHKLPWHPQSNIAGMLGFGLCIVTQVMIQWHALQTWPHMWMLRLFLYSAAASVGSPRAKAVCTTWHVA